MGDDHLRQVRHEVRREAAPFALAILGANALLSLVSRGAGWELFGSRDWWVWLLLAAPSGLLFATLVVGPSRVGLERLQREVAITLLALLGAGTGAATLCLVVSLTRWTPSGPQLLLSAVVVLVTNVITYALVFWEVDDGGPIARALAEARDHPDFQFPQDENRELARPGWAPALVDYLYLSLTNSVAFSPTDAMPLTHHAKVFMGLEATISLLTVLVIGARAVNILA
ncbi:MAG TPA: hypothetical protein VGF10_14115 [Gaiella sp.]